MVFPFVAIFFAMILFLFRVIQVERDVQLALYQAGRNMAVSSASIEGGISDFVLAQYYFQQEIQKSKYIEDYVKGAKSGIVVLCSGSESEYIHLKANYTIEFPVTILQWDGLSFTAQCKQHRWVGRQLAESAEQEYVYITPEGEVYHTSSQCNYLDLSIYRTEIEEIEYLRNDSGQKYNSCKRCADESENLEFVYVTDYGTTFHGSLECPSLKRTVEKVLKSEVRNRRICEKCGKNNHQETENKT